MKIPSIKNHYLDYTSTFNLSGGGGGIRMDKIMTCGRSIYFDQYNF